MSKKVAKAEATKVEATKAEATKAEATKAEATKAEEVKAEATKAEATKAEEVKVTRRAKKAIRATNGTVSVNSKMIVTSEAVELDSAALKDKQFMKHVEYGVECGILEWVK